MPVTLGAHDVHVRYRLIDRFGEDEAARCIDTLSAGERKRAARFASARHRLMFIAAHAMLRTALSGYQNVRPEAWTFGEAANGKPVLAERHHGIDLTFNLAHTDDLVACAVARGADVGVDVEAVKSRVHALDVAMRFFSPAEVDELRTCGEGDRDARFIEIWTLKESYIKARGEGLSRQLAGFGFTFDAETSCRFMASMGDHASWQVELFAPTPAHRLAVAVRAGGVRHTLTAWNDEDPDRQPISVLRRWCAAEVTTPR